MADFEIERPSVDVQAISPTYNVNTPSFTIEINGSTVGQRGEKGEKGDPGEPGAPNILTIGTVVSGDTARATIEGTTPNQVLNLVLPQGADGQDGQDGINGVDGQDGRDGQDGQDGEDGVGIQSVVQTTTSTEDDGNNVVTVTLTDGTTSTFTVQNGSKGSTGATGAQGPAGEDGDSGVYIGTTAPTDTDKDVWIDTSDGQTIAVPTRLSQLTDDLGSSPVHTHSQYITSHQDLSSYATINYVDGLVGDIESLLGGI